MPIRQNPKTCFMKDAEGRNPTEEETDFCKNVNNF